MPNLLPQKEKDVLYRHFRNKIVVLSTCLFMAVLLVASLLLVPAYILSLSKLSAAEKELQVLKESVSYRENRNIEEELQKTEQELMSLSSVIKNNELQKLIFVVLDNEPSGINLTGVTYRRVNADSSEISIQGVANSRERLINYTDDLRINPSFKKVDLPISNLASNEEIEFNITITI